MSVENGPYIPVSLLHSTVADVQEDNRSTLQKLMDSANAEYARTNKLEAENAALKDELRRVKDDRFEIMNAIIRARGDLQKLNDGSSSYRIDMPHWAVDTSKNLK